MQLILDQLNSLVCFNLLVFFLFAFYSRSHSRLWNFRLFFLLRVITFSIKYPPSSASTLPHYRNQAVKLVKGWKWFVSIYLQVVIFASCLDVFMPQVPNPDDPEDFPALAWWDQIRPGQQTTHGTWTALEVMFIYLKKEKIKPTFKLSLWPMHFSQWAELLLHRPLHSLWC